MRKQRIFSFLLALVIAFGSTKFSKPLVSEAASRAKLKSVKVELKENKSIRRQRNTWYVVKGTRAKLIVTPIFNKKISNYKATKKFNSSKKKIVTVNKKGVFFAKKTGKAVIKVTLKTKKTKTIAAKKKSRKITLISISRSAFKRKFGKKPTSEKPDAGLGDNSISGINPVRPPEETMRQILDDMTDSNGTLTLTVDFLKKYGYVDWWTYSVPTEFTKAKKVKLPELPDLQWDSWASKTLRTDVVYSVPNSFTCSWIYLDDIYDGDTGQSDNQLNIATISSFYNYDKKGAFIGDSSVRATFLGWDGGVTRFRIQNASNKTWKTFQFEVYNPDYNAEYYRMYVEMKKISKEALKDCTTDMEKVRKLIDLVHLNRIGNVKTYSYSCGTYATYLERYCNLNGIPCTQRMSTFDRPYGQTPIHVNNLILIDGEVYIVDSKYGDFIKYWVFYDENCCYLDYTNVLVNYPNTFGTNQKGKLDMNLYYHGGTAYQDILKKAGYNAVLHDHNYLYDDYYN